jgi:quercetin dioxygenase-like cupin family protein
MMPKRADQLLNYSKAVRRVDVLLCEAGTVLCNLRRHGKFSVNSFARHRHRSCFVSTIRKGRRPMSVDQYLDRKPAAEAGQRNRRTAVSLIIIVGLAALLAGISLYGAAHAPAVLPAVPHGAMQMSGAESNAVVRPRAEQQPIACEPLPNVPGKSITTLLVTFPPNAFTPRHRHPGSVTAYVVKGTLRSQLNDGPIGTFGPGATWFEPPGTIHSMVENPSPTEPAEIMAIFVADSDCGPLTIFDD